MNEESLFAAVLEQLPADRQRYLKDVCGDDAALLKRMCFLLAAHAKAAGILELSDPPKDPVSDTAGDPFTEKVGAVIAGRFKLLEQIGEGGMGTVWVAEQTQPVRRKVALKLIKSGMDSKAVLSRFEAERQALALMDHPNIAKVLDGGTTEAGRPYFIMEYVKGIPITKYCDNVQLNIQERLDLFVQVCQAVQHAHQKGIIHRDLKPSNILVCLYDGRPVPKVIDFGLAKAIYQPLTEHTLHTAHGVLIGTPLYMSPEQAEINNLDVDTRSDIYSLGVILYELLTGSTPLERKRFKEAAWQEMLRLIKEEEPPRPSERLSSSDTLPSLAAQRKLEPLKLTRAVRGELDWIVMKALEKERSRRYETANGFARDVQRYLADEAVEACPPSATYRLRKFARKHRAGIATAAAIIFLLIAGIAASTWQAIRATQAEEEAAHDRDKALKAETQATKNAQLAFEKGEETKQEREEAIKQAKIAKKNEEKANRVSEDLRYSSALEKIQLGQAVFASGNLTLARESLEKVPADLRRWEWHYLKRKFEGDIFTIYGHTDSVHSVAYRPDGRQLATASFDGTVKIWDAHSGFLLRELKGHKNKVYCVAYSPDGARLASASDDRTAIIWDPQAGTRLLTITKHNAALRSVAFSPDGSRLVTCGVDVWAKIWNAQNGDILMDLKGTGSIWNANFSPDGSRLATAGYSDQTAHIWDASTGMKLLALKGHRGTVESVSFSPDGTRLATASTDGSAKIWDARTGELLREVDAFSRVAFSPDGALLAAGSYPDAAKIWDAHTGKLLLELKGHSAAIWSLAFSPDGMQLATGSPDKTVRIWDVRTGVPRVEIKGYATTVQGVALSPEGTWLAAGSNDNTVKLWNARTGAPGLVLKGHTNIVSSVSFSPDGKRLASASNDRTAKIWNARTGEPIRSLIGHSGAVLCVSISPDGTKLATASTDKTARIWDARTGVLLKELKGHTAAVGSVSFHPDGTKLATGSADKSVKVWEVRTGRPVLEIQAENAAVVAFSPDGIRLATSAGGNTAKIWDALTGTPLVELKGQRLPVTSLSFSPDGARLATGTYDRLRANTGSFDDKAILWDVRTGSAVAELKGHNGFVRLVCFSLDGTRLATVGQDNSVIVWNASTGPTTVDKYGQLSSEELAYRQFWTGPRASIHKDEFVKAQAAEDTFAANFHFERFRALFKQDVAANPGNAQIHFDLAKILYEKKDVEGSDAAFKDAIKIDSGFKSQVALFWFSQGKNNARSAQWDAALVNYSKALQLAPETSEWLFERASAFLKLNRLEEAIADYSQIIQIEPELAKVWNNRGLAYARSNQLDKALADYSKAIELAPMELSARVNKAAMLKKSGIYKLVVEEYSKLIELKPTLSTFWLERAFAYEKLKQYDLAIVDCSKVIEMYPKSASAWNIRGFAEERLGQWDKALTDYATALELNPKNAAWNNELAWRLATHVDVKRRDSKKALELAKKAVEFAPKVATNWNTLGAAYYVNGEWTAALNALNKAMELNKGGETTDWLFAAMAQWQLGEKDQARRFYDRATTWMDANPRRVTDDLRRFRAEAAALMAPFMTP